MVLLYTVRLSFSHGVRNEFRVNMEHGTKSQAMIKIERIVVDAVLCTLGPCENISPGPKSV